MKLHTSVHFFLLGNVICGGKNILLHSVRRRQLVLVKLLHAVLKDYRIKTLKQRKAGSRDPTNIVLIFCPYGGLCIPFPAFSPSFAYHGHVVLGCGVHQRVSLLQTARVRALDGVEQVRAGLGVRHSEVMRWWGGELVRWWGGEVSDLLDSWRADCCLIKCRGLDGNKIVQ